MTINRMDKQLWNIHIMKYYLVISLSHVYNTYLCLFLFLNLYTWKTMSSHCCLQFQSSHYKVYFSLFPYLWLRPLIVTSTMFNTFTSQWISLYVFSLPALPPDDLFATHRLWEGVLRQASTWTPSSPHWGLNTLLWATVSSYFVLPSWL